MTEFLMVLAIVALLLLVPFAHELITEWRRAKQAQRLYQMLTEAHRLLREGRTEEGERMRAQFSQACEEFSK